MTSVNVQDFRVDQSSGKSHIANSVITHRFPVWVIFKSRLITDLVSFNTSFKSLQETESQILAAPNSPFGVILFASQKTHSKAKKGEIRDRRRSAAEHSEVG